MRTVEEILAEVLTDRIFYATSQGGVTLSGGEPTAQPDFTEAILAACKREGLHTCMETCGWCKEDTLLRLIPLTDLFLLDWKISDEALHRQYTGVSNRTILQNLALLQEHRARVILRCPLIPGINTNTAHYDGIINLARQYSCIEQIDLEPYHPMGIGKAEALGKPAAYANHDFLDPAVTESAKAYIQSHVSTKVKINGASSS